MIHQIDSKTRVKKKYSFYFKEYLFCLQRKKWYGWKTVEYTFPMLWADKITPEMINYLFYKEGKLNMDGELGFSNNNGIINALIMNNINNM